MMTRRTKLQIAELKDQILKLLVEGNNDIKIIQQIQLTNRNQYYKYKTQLLAKAIEVQAQKTEYNILHETTILKERLTNVYRDSILKLRTASPRDAADLIVAIHQVALTILRLEGESLKYIRDNKLNIKRLVEVDSKLY